MLRISFQSFQLNIEIILFNMKIFSMESIWVQTAISAIRVIAFVCDVITFPIYLVLQQPWKRRQLSKRIKVSILVEENNDSTFEYIQTT